MKFVRAMTAALFLMPLAAQAAEPLAPTGTLRVSFLSTNPTQAVRDAQSGELRGVAVDLARELAKRGNVPVSFTGVAMPVAVIEAVAKGEADIGFVAFAPERVGTVAFSQIYMLVQQTFVVPEASPIKTVRDVDVAGRRIAGGQGDSITLYMKRNIKQATLIETDNSLADTQRKFAAREIDAFGANRQRLTNWLKDLPGYRILPDALFGVPQTIIVPNGKPEALVLANAVIDEMRTNGALQAAMTRSGIIGIEVAPPGHRLDR